MPLASIVERAVEAHVNATPVSFEGAFNPAVGSELKPDCGFRPENENDFVDGSGHTKNDVSKRGNKNKSSFMYIDYIASTLVFAAFPNLFFP